jgi:hypothetical protein
MALGLHARQRLLEIPQRLRQHPGVCCAFLKTMIRYSVCIAVIIETGKNQKLTQRFFCVKADLTSDWTICWTYDLIM